MPPQFSPATHQIISRAKEIASAQSSAFVSEAHLFSSLLEVEGDPQSIVSMLLVCCDVSREEARFYAQSALEISPLMPGKEPQLSDGAKGVLSYAKNEAFINYSAVEPHHLLIGCVRCWPGSPFRKVLTSLGFSTPQLRRHLIEILARKKANPLENLTANAKIALEAAHAEMRASYCGRIAAAHLLLGLLSDQESVALLERAGCDLEELKKKARDSICSDGEIASPQKKFSPGAKRALERAAREAKRAGHKTIDCGHLLLGLLPQGETRGEKWKARGQKLDCVDFLWTAEEVRRLKSAFINVTVSPIAKEKTASNLGSSSLWTAASFLAALLWDFYLIHTPHAHNLWIVVWITVLLLLLGAGIVAIFVALIRRNLPSAFRFLLSALFGWLLGAALGAFLYQIASLKPL